jgi:hypothetical protein
VPGAHALGAGRHLAGENTFSYFVNPHGSGASLCHVWAEQRLAVAAAEQERVYLTNGVSGG